MRKKRKIRYKGLIKPLFLPSGEYRIIKRLSFKKIPIVKHEPTDLYRQFHSLSTAVL